MPVPDEFRQAEEERDSGAQGDQRVHRRRPAMPQCAPGPFKELTPQAEHNESAQGSENPFHPGGPHHPSHRKDQHWKGQHGRTNQIEQGKVGPGLHRRWPYFRSRRGSIARLLNGGDQAWRGGERWIEDHTGAVRCQVYAGIGDPRDFFQGPLNSGHAGGTVHPLHVQGSGLKGVSLRLRQCFCGHRTDFPR